MLPATGKVIRHGRELGDRLHSLGAALETANPRHLLIVFIVLDIIF